jgi:hypothetical protein
MNSKNEIAIYLFDPEKKDYYTATQMRKLMTEVKSQLNKRKHITVIVVETDNVIS